MISPAARQNFRLLALALAVGVLAGIGGAFFLYTLQLITELRAHHRWLIFTLPLSGILIGWAYHRIPSSQKLGHALILDEIHEPKKVLPFRMAPFIYFATLLSHLGGASVGREGTAVQIGASLGDQLNRLFPSSPEDRRLLLKAGMGAGFAAVIGAPLAGLVFGLEVAPPFRIRPREFFYSALSAGAAYFIARMLSSEHLAFPPILEIHYSTKLVLVLLLTSVAFGLAARLFVASTHAMEKLFHRITGRIWLHPLIGALPLVAIFWFWNGSELYAGLGVPGIQAAFYEPSAAASPFLKLVFTALSLGAGFKGGEFVPLVFIGTTLGSAIAALAGLPLALLSALGFVAVFGAAAATPLACMILAVEFFGPAIALPAFLCCYLSYFVAGQRGIYPGQRRQPRPGLREMFARFR